ncbi:hypothetical protein HDU99_007141, partial [Rhizoclosmatium hyalinum]
IAFVQEGKVKVTVNKSSFEVGAGSQFMIPRGNQYSFANTGVGQVKLFFVQSREIETGVGSASGAGSSDGSKSAAEEEAKPVKKSAAGRKGKKVESGVSEAEEGEEAVVVKGKKGKKGFVVSDAEEAEEGVKKGSKKESESPEQGSSSSLGKSRRANSKK